MGQQGPQQQSLLAPEPTTHQDPFPHDARERWAEHLPPAPNQANQLMMRLERKRGHGGDDEPFPREARSHIRFERIHLFEGSNGRTGYILISRSLMGSGPDRNPHCFLTQSPLDLAQSFFPAAVSTCPTSPTLGVLPVGDT